MRDIMLSINRRVRPVSWSHTGHTTEHKYAQSKDRHTTEPIGFAYNRGYLFWQLNGFTNFIF